jgi:PAS domain S-box-containing protein
VATTRPRRPAPDAGFSETNQSPDGEPAIGGDNRTILHHALEEAARLLVADGAMAYLLDPETGTLRFADDAGITDDRRREWVRSLKVEPGVGMFGRAVAEGRTVLTGGYQNDPSFVHFPGADRLVETLTISSFLVAPLVAAERTFGAMGIFTSRPDAYGDHDVALVRALADHAAQAMANAELIQALGRSRLELGRRADAERSVREIAADISALRDTEAILQQTVDEARRLLDSDSSRIDMLEPDETTLAWAYASGEDAVRTRETGLDATFAVGEGIAGRTVATGQAFRTGDYLADDRFDHTDVSDTLVRVTGFRSVLSAPLRGESGPLGAISVSSHRPDAYDDAHADLLQALADQAAIAITNARLIDDLERSRRELAARAETERSLRDIAARITSLGDPDEILARVVEESRRLLGSDGAHLTRMSDDGTYLIPVIVAGGMDADTEAWLKQMRFPLGGGINGLAAEAVQPTWTDDYPADARIPHEPGDDEAAARMGLAAMAAAPLRAPAGEVIGTLAVSYATPRQILPDELELLQGLADQAAIAITNSNLYELLGESEERYRHLVQNSPDLIWSIDADARFTFVSDTCQRLTGWVPEDLLGRHFGALVHESSREVAEIDWTAGMGPDRELRGRVNLLHRDGRPVPAEFIAFATQGEDGGFTGANGSVRDMSERDRLERELRESEERYRFLVENSPDIIFSTDADGRYTYYSETIERLTGHRAGELIGRHFSEIIDLDSFSDAGPAWQRFIDEPAQMQVHRFKMRRTDGGLAPVEVNAIGMTDRDGRFAGIHGAARDISERERLERDLRRQAAELASSQERSHLARELHDSVTQALFSMTLVTRSTELLLDRDPGAVKAKLSSLRDLQREALAEMRALIFELRPGNLEQDGLLPALRTHTAALQGRIGLPVVVTSELSERLPLEVEEVVYRIAQEALHNVVKHAAARQVELTLDRRGDGLLLRIRDDGKGFDAKAVPEGHLGLAGMRARAARIGASLTVASRPSEGTVIEVVVPNEAIARASASAAAGAAISSSAE